MRSLYDINQDFAKQVDKLTMFQPTPATALTLEIAKLLVLLSEKTDVLLEQLSKKK